MPKCTTDGNDQSLETEGNMTFIKSASKFYSKSKIITNVTESPATVEGDNVIKCQYLSGSKVVKNKKCLRQQSNIMPTDDTCAVNGYLNGNKIRRKCNGETNVCTQLKSKGEGHENLNGFSDQHLKPQGQPSPVIGNGKHVRTKSVAQFNSKSLPNGHKKNHHISKFPNGSPSTFRAKSVKGSKGTAMEDTHARNRGRVFQFKILWYSLVEKLTSS